MKAIRKIAVATAVSLAVAAPSALAFPGDVPLYNNTPYPIAPYFKLNCLNTGWIFFGGVGPYDKFTWGPIGPEGCQVEFTYVISGMPGPQDPVKGNHRTQFTQPLDESHVLVVGTGGILRELEGPDERGR